MGLLVKKRGFDQVIKEEDASTDALSSSRSRSDSETGSTCSSWSDEDDDDRRKSSKIRRKSGSGSSAGSADHKKRRRRKWGPSEDKQLRAVVAELQRPGATAANPKVSWSTVAKRIPSRSAKQCRDRWTSITPGIRKREWTQQEDELLLRLYAKHKNSWVRIAKEFNGRNDNMLKSRFRALMKRIKAECNKQHNMQLHQQQQQQQRQHMAMLPQMHPAHPHAHQPQHMAPPQLPAPVISQPQQPLAQPQLSATDSVSSSDSADGTGSPLLQAHQFQPERLSDNLFIMRSPQPQPQRATPPPPIFEAPEPRSVAPLKAASVDGSESASATSAASSGTSASTPVSTASSAVGRGGNVASSPIPPRPTAKSTARFTSTGPNGQPWVSSLRQVSVNSHDVAAVSSGAPGGDDELADWCAFMVNELE